MTLVEKFITVGYIDDIYGRGHHVNGVCERLNENYAVRGMSDHYPTVANIKMICDKDTGAVISVELVKESA